MGDPGHVGGIVGEGRVLADAVDDVGPESVDPAFEPERQHVVHGRHDTVVVPVEVGLRRLEQVEVPLLRGRVERPGRGRQVEGRHPVVGWRAVGAGVPPHVPVPVGAVGSGPGIDEPGVAVRGVVGHPVDDDLETSGMGVGDQPVEVLEGPEQWVDIAVVADVVPEVGHRRAVERGEPQRVHAQPDQVVEVGPDAGQVAHAVAVGVGEGPGVDLVEDGLLPPGDVGLHRGDQASTRDLRRVKVAAMLARLRPSASRVPRMAGDTVRMSTPRWSSKVSWTRVESPSASRR